MAEEVGAIKFFKTDDGLRIEVSGEAVKQMCCVCCGPSDKEAKVVCCSPEEKK